MPDISMKGDVYDKVRKHCQKNEMSIAEFINELCETFFKQGEKDKKEPLFNKEEQQILNKSDQR